MRTIPLPSGQAHIAFAVDVGDERVRVWLDWLTRYEYFAVHLTASGEQIIAGRGLHPDQCQLRDTRLGEVASLRLEGDAPTLENLGVRNRLVLEVF